jgi:hypothetical protein
LTTHLNRSLLQIIGFGWLGFLVAGIVVTRLFAISKVTVLVDRAKCDRQAWRQVSDRYAELFKDHERKRIQLAQMVLISDHGEEVREVVPTPVEFQALETYGEPSTERLRQLQAGFAEVEVLTCYP